MATGRDAARGSRPHPPPRDSWMIESTRFDVDSRYRLRSSIGTGAYGVVASAEDAETRRMVALKKIFNPFRHAVACKRALREIRISRSMNHENILGLRDLPPPNDFASFQDLYIVTDLMDTDLYQVIISPQPLANEHVQFFVYQLLRGLKYLHSAGVIHRDIKPNNLLVNADCDLKIADFGLARCVEDEAADTDAPSLDQHMTEYVATRWYRAPELLLSAGNYGKEVDTWAVGCVLAELLRRRPLFPGRDHLHQLQLIFRVLGKPRMEDVPYVTNHGARNFLNSLPNSAGIAAAELVPHGTDPNAIHLLGQLLRVNPADRISVEDALKHPYFSKLHDPTDEPVAASKCSCADFETTQLTTMELKAVMYDEIRRVHPELPERPPFARVDVSASVRAPAAPPKAAPAATAAPSATGAAGAGAAGAGREGGDGGARPASISEEKHDPPLSGRIRPRTQVVTATTATPMTATGGMALESSATSAVALRSGDGLDGDGKHPEASAATMGASRGHGGGEAKGGDGVGAAYTHAGAPEAGVASHGLQGVPAAHQFVPAPAQFVHPYYGHPGAHGFAPGAGAMPARPFSVPAASDWVGAGGGAPGFAPPWAQGAPGDAAAAAAAAAAAGASMMASWHSGFPQPMMPAQAGGQVEADTTAVPRGPRRRSRDTETPSSGEEADARVRAKGAGGGPLPAPVGSAGTEELQPRRRRRGK
eukprot:CAMPEP_0196772060 /NCGR_PEP_ID=MMETSP1104-20130614/2023_1 /TAXON_ID=33652 /ORGANISM="Cafeteria sp., Strain Caron Lab Isolate" /LENGTH=706 /DNA_ID=CAMNT_0042142191 /DNA_START=49 /DNA_END=2169 /DNA_ORIENTATION=+